MQDLPKRGGLPLSAADLPRPVAVDRTALLRPGEVQEHTHICRRAQVAIADRVNRARRALASL